MSVELLRELVYDHQALSIDELSLLLGGLSRSGTHRYLEATELRFGQLLVIFKKSESDSVRQRILEELLPGSGWAVTRLTDDLDINGDGDICTDDALQSCVHAIDQASVAIKVLLHRNEGATQYIDARRALADAAERCLAATAVIDFLQKHQPKRRKAREVSRG